MYIYMYIYIYTYTHTHTNTHTFIQTGLILMGAPGSGKSSLMASAGVGHRYSHPDDLTMMHFSSSCKDATGE